MSRVAGTVRYRPLGAELSAATVERLAPASTAGFGHVVDRGVLSGLRPLQAGATMVGRAFTVRVEGIDSAAVHAAVDLASPGDVVVIDMQGVEDRAPVGAIIGQLFAEKGVAGLVVDGAVTDTDALQQLGIPVYARAVTPLTTRLTGDGGRIGYPVEICGTVVEPGNYVLGDADGLVVLSQEQIDEHLDGVLLAASQEHHFLEDVRAGARLFELSGASSTARIVVEQEEQ